MSSRLLALKEKLTELRKMFSGDGGVAHEREYGLRLDKVSNILVENEGKIWLRTRVGEPMLVELEKSVDEALRTSLQGGDESSVEAAIKDVEARAFQIDAESRRRDMVVT